MSEPLLPHAIKDWLHPVSDDSGRTTLHIAEHHRADVRVQSYVNALRQKQPVTLHFIPLDELRELKTAQPDASAGQDFSSSQKRVVGLFRQATGLHASDIHLEIGRGGTTLVMMRVHGDLVRVDSISQEDGMNLASTIVLSMCDVAEAQFNPNRQQDGRLRRDFLHGLNLFGARYAHTPAVYGLYVVMRVIPDDGASPPTLDELGYLPGQQKSLRRMLQRPEGIVVLSGPTGSGKSTTLRTFARQYLDSTGNLRRLLTIEDPPEGSIEGAVQTAIVADKNNPAAVATAWVRMMSAGLRLDPDAIIVGELRDADSARTGVTAAMTGHLLMTTLHANDPINILERLLGMGINPALLTDPQLFIGLISQRLVQLLCPACKRPWSEVKDALTPEEHALLTHGCQPENLYFRHEAGCGQCHRGIAGRTVIAEVISPDARFMQLYREQGKLAARAYWHTTLGGITRNAHLLHHVNAGRVDPLAADRISPLDEDRWLTSDAGVTS